MQYIGSAGNEFLDFWWIYLDGAALVGSSWRGFLAASMENMEEKRLCDVVVLAPAAILFPVRQQFGVILQFDEWGRAGSFSCTYCNVNACTQ